MLATVNSLKLNIQNELSSLGTNSIYIDKWDYMGGADYPWWKYQKRPSPKYRESLMLKQRSQLASHVAFQLESRSTVNYGDVSLLSVNVTGVTPDEQSINPVEIQYGRYLSSNEFKFGNAAAVIGYTNAEDLFGNPERALGKAVKLFNTKVTIIGVLKKTGASLTGFNSDQAIMVPYQFARKYLDEDNASPKIIVKADESISSEALYNELRGIMRSIRMLGPRDEDNFSLNKVSAMADQVNSIFGSINLGGWAIGILSLVVGAFGISNIMFVTVKERTPIIGLKKAIGAKSRSILSEFLLEAAIISILGGLIGILLVYVLTIVLSGALGFPVFISMPILLLAIFICLVIGVVSGIIPAYSAAKLDPVVAIRSK